MGNFAIDVIEKNLAIGIFDFFVWNMKYQLILRFFF